MFPTHSSDHSDDTASVHKYKRRKLSKGGNHDAKNNKAALKTAIKGKISNFYANTGDHVVVMFVTKNSQRKHGCDIEVYNPSTPNNDFFNRYWTAQKDVIEAYYSDYHNKTKDDDDDNNVLNGETRRVNANDRMTSPLPECDLDIITAATTKNKRNRNLMVERECDDNDNDDNEISTTQDSSQTRIEDDNDGLDKSHSQLSTTTTTTTGCYVMNNSTNSSFSIGNNELVDVVDEETMGHNMEILEFIEQKQYVQEDHISQFIITLFQETSKKTMVPTEEELTNCLVALEERYGIIEDEGTQEDEWYLRTFKFLFGGPSERAEGNVRERLERYQKHYKNEVKILFTLFQGANLLQGDYSQIYKQKFKEINRAIDNFYSMRILHYHNYLTHDYQ